MKAFSSGERVLLRARKGKKEAWVLATFHAMQTRNRVIVSVEEGKLDDETVRLVDLRSLRPYYDDPTDRQRRARIAARKFKMGVRLFRVGSPTGRQFYVDAVEGENAYGHVVNRKTIQEVPLHSLWPNITRSILP